MAYLKEIKVSFQRKRVDDDLLNKPVKSSKQVYTLFKEMENELKEKVVVLHLGPDLKILSYEVAAIWTWIWTTINPREIFRTAVAGLAHSLVIVHNHPLWKPKPSKEDKNACKALVEFSEAVQIKLNDFIIIWEDWYFSFDENWMI